MKHILIILLAFSAIGLRAQHVDFRGANHCGIYPNEKNHSGCVSQVSDAGVVTSVKK